MDVFHVQRIVFFAIISCAKLVCPFLLFKLPWLISCVACHIIYVIHHIKPKIKSWSSQTSITMILMHLEWVLRLVTSMECIAICTKSIGDWTWYPLVDWWGGMMLWEILTSAFLCSYGLVLILTILYPHTCHWPSFICSMVAPK